MGPPLNVRAKPKRKPTGLAPVIVVHGGAGERAPSGPDARAANAGCRRAAQIGWAILAEGGSAMDAVEAAVRRLEDDPRFNAGRGSCLTRAGTVEMDAAIMDGEGWRVGAVAAMRRVRHPIEVARRVLEDGEHVLLVGAGALAFAREQGVRTVPPDYQVTAAGRAALARELGRRARGRAAPPAAEPNAGTVGAVARDARGHLAAATSTGGMIAKRPGRVGDSPIAGAGTYADDEGGAASATGHGERIMRVLLAKVAVDRMREGATAAQAARWAIDELGARVGGRGGIILIDRRGRVGMAFNTRSMSWAQRGHPARRPG